MRLHDIDLEEPLASVAAELSKHRKLPVVCGSIVGAWSVSLSYMYACLHVYMFMYV